MKVGLVCCAISLAAAACSSSPEIRYYTLSPESPSSHAASGARARYAIDNVALPDLLDRPQIVVRSGANVVEVLDYDRWAAPLSDQLRRVLAADLAGRLGPDVIMDPGLPSTSATRRISLSVRAFDPGRDYESVIEASWTISRGGPGSIAENTPIHRARHFARAGSSSPTAIVATMSDLLASLADDVSASLATD